MAPSSRPVPRWLHVWAVVTVVDIALLLVLGGFVTTFRVGMADPVWPTEPWYLANNFKVDFGYLVEHFHRIVGWSLAPLGLVLTIGMWAVEPRKGLRWFGIAAIVAITITFGVFQGALMNSRRGEEGLPVFATLAAMLAALVVVFVAAIRAVSGGGPGGSIRAIVLLGMVAAMTQGLLGGIRVRYNDLFGREMSAIHGSFAQIVFGLLVAVAVLSGPTKPGPLIPDAIARKLRWQTLALLVFTYLQIVWGAWIRHFPGPFSSRLHLMFAFVVVALATLTIKQALSDPAARQRLKVPARFLMALITIQVLFGIEAWLGKFLSGTLPELETITAEKAFIRTVHAHVGTWVLGMAVIFALITRRYSAKPVGPLAEASLNWKSEAPSLA